MKQQHIFTQLFYAILLGLILFLSSCSDDVSGPETNGDDDTVTEYTISASAGEGGVINPSGSITVEEGDDQLFEITADDGYTIEDVIINGASVGQITSYTFENVNEDQTIEAFFVEDPDLPDTTPVEVDLAYFEGANAGDTEEYLNFNMAETFANSTNSIMLGYMSAIDVYFGMGSEEEAEVIDGVWTWEYTYGTLTIIITAEDIGTGMEWHMMMDGTDPDTGIVYDEHVFFYGFTSYDGSYGERMYYSDDVSVEVPVITYEWEVTSEDNYVMSLNFTDDESDETMSMNYVKDGEHHTIESTDMYGPGVSVIYWNTESMTGYYDLDGERKCWNDQYLNTSCTELGY